MKSIFKILIVSVVLTSCSDADFKQAKEETSLRFTIKEITIDSCKYITTRNTNGYGGINIIHKPTCKNKSHNK
jgi:hypothetical protein